MNLALKVSDKDNVAVIFSSGISDGAAVVIRDKAGNEDTVIVTGDVPYGHKIATRDIPSGADIIKYGETIGAASRDIKKGEYTHVHNLESKRARGDMEAGR